MIEKISLRQTNHLAMGVIMGTVFFPIVQETAENSGRDGWMAILPGLFIAFPFVYLTLYAYLKAPNHNLLQAAKTLLGPWLAYPIIVYFAFTSACFAGLLLREGGELFARSIMIETPLAIFLLGELILLVFMVYAGLEVFARFNEIVVIPILTSIIIVLLFNIPKAEIDYLKPYFYNGLRPLTKELSRLATHGFEYIVFLWIMLPLVNNPREIIRSSLNAYLIVGLILTAGTATAFCVFSPEESLRLYYGIISLAREVGGKTFRGLESFFVVLWLGANLIKTAAFFFCFYHACQAIIPFRRSLWSVALMGIVLLLISFIPENDIALLRAINAADDYLMLPLGSAGTFLLALGAYIRTRRTK